MEIYKFIPSIYKEKNHLKSRIDDESEQKLKKCKISLAFFLFSVIIIQVPGLR